jgi:hypothetical protein
MAETQPPAADARDEQIKALNDRVAELEAQNKDLTLRAVPPPKKVNVPPKRANAKLTAAQRFGDIQSGRPGVIE